MLTCMLWFYLCLGLWVLTQTDWGNQVLHNCYGLWLWAIVKGVRLLFGVTYHHPNGVTWDYGKSWGSLSLRVSERRVRMPSGRVVALYREVFWHYGPHEIYLWASPSKMGYTITLHIWSAHLVHHSH
jgi:hypothetical protein